jgi:hypothetical protein
MLIMSEETVMRTNISLAQACALQRVAEFARLYELGETEVTVYREATDYLGVGVSIPVGFNEPEAILVGEILRWAWHDGDAGHCGTYFVRNLRISVGYDNAEDEDRVCIVYNLGDDNA